MSPPRRVLHVFPYDPRHLGLTFAQWAVSQRERWPLAAVQASALAERSSVHVIGPGSRRLAGAPEVAEHRSLSSGPRWRDWGDDWSTSLTRELARLGPDDVCVIHLNDYPAARLAQRAAGAARVVLVFHGRGLGTFDEYLASADRLVVLRHDAARALISRGASREQVTVLVPSVDRRRFTPARDEDCLLNETRPRLGFIGRLERSKGVLEIPAVLAELASRGVHAQAELIGSATSEQRSKLRQAAAELGVGDRIELLGELPIDSVAQRIRTWRLLLLPSYTEGHPLVALEACASRVAVAAVAGVLPTELEAQPAISTAARERYSTAVAELLSAAQRPPADAWVPSHEQGAASWDELLGSTPRPRARPPLLRVSRRARARRLRPPRRIARAALGRR